MLRDKHILRARDSKDGRTILSNSHAVDLFVIAYTGANDEPHQLAWLPGYRLISKHKTYAGAFWRAASVAHDQGLFDPIG